MDKGADKGSRWGWLPTAMPGLAKLMAEKKREFGPAHVAECWRRGVIHGEPGWFFAREGTLAIGTPFDAEQYPELANWAAAQVTSTQVTLLMARPPAQEGNHGS